MEIQYPDIGVCGLSCLLCPMYHTNTESRCGGCKTGSRMAVGCSLITCAIKRKGVEFCWDCSENADCGKWRKHRDFGKQRDSPKCYRTLEADIAFVRKNGVGEFYRLQKAREDILRDMLQNFNEGRSKSYYCIAATVMEIEELRGALAEAKDSSAGLEIKEKSKALHSLLDGTAERKGYYLKLRK